MTDKARITGFIRNTECLHCGRALKIGIMIENYGQIGADCLAAKVSYKYQGKTYRYKGQSLRDFAMAAQQGDAVVMSRFGWQPDKLNFDIDTPLTYAQ